MASPLYCSSFNLSNTKNILSPSIHPLKKVIDSLSSIHHKYMYLEKYSLLLNKIFLNHRLNNYYENIKVRILT